MSKKTTYLLWILLVVVIGTILHWYLCCSVCYTDKNCITTTNNEAVTPETKNPTLLPFSIKDDNGSLSFSVNESFNFKKSTFSIHDSVSTSVNNGIAMIKEYLDTNGNKQINITGYYTNDEVNNSAFPNLGHARANAVKNYMTFKGVSSKLINTNGQLYNDLIADSNHILYGPLSFDMITKTQDSSKDEELLKTACDRIKEEPLMLYFKTGQASINLTEQQRQKFADISACVDKLGVKVQVVGHTDNTGTPENNLKLGQERTDFVKNYLIHNGILPTNITTISEGQNKPIADNNTDEGRAKNRRIEITIN